MSEASHASGEDHDSHARRIQAAMSTVLGARASERNRLRALRNGVEIFPAMLDAVRRAERSIDFLTFIYWQGDIASSMAQALSERAAAGVEVRVLLDAVGTRRMDQGLVERMRDAGAQVRVFRPTDWRFWRTAHRTHRKVLVCDEQVGFTGGVGIAGEWEGDARDPSEWRDTHFEVRGPAVSSLRSAFLTNWIDTVGIVPDADLEAPLEPGDAGGVAMHVVRSQPSVGWTDADLAVRALLKAARSSIRITTAYFTPDDELCNLLCRRAADGIDVHVLLPGPHIDKDFVRVAAIADLGALLGSDVRVSEFEPTMLHTKVLTVDASVALVGSVNLNRRSLQHDDELAVIAYDREVAGTLDEHFAADLERSHDVTLDRWEERGPLQRVGEKALAPVRRWI